jgi:hypothetical protein
MVRQMRALRDGSMLFTGAFSTTDGIGYLVHKLDRFGNVTHILDSNEPFLPGGGRQLERRIVVAGPQRFWVSNVSKYDIQLMTLDGDTLRTFDSAPSWWKQSDVSRAPRVHDIGVDSAGLLWITIAVPTPNPAAQRELMRSNPNVISLDALAKMVDHIVRVIDPMSGEIIAEQRYDYFPLTFLRPSIAFTIRNSATTDLSDYRLDVWRFGISK